MIEADRATEDTGTGKLAQMAAAWLAHPLVRDLAIDDSRTTIVRRQLIQDKRFLRAIYEEWYGWLVESLPAVRGSVLELGSGAGFMREYLPGVITSEVLMCPDVDLLLDGRQLPFRSGSLRAIVMTDVLHHIPDCGRFLHEAARCVTAGGTLLLVEPWVTPWSRIVYGRFHHEPFRPDAESWSFATTGPLSGANIALPWIVFDRDRDRFTREFPEWQIQTAEPFMPLRYLLSGGVSLRSLAPGWSHGTFRALERVLRPWSSTFAMFAKIALMRRA